MIKCKNCRYCKADKNTTVDNSSWVAMECKNPESVYYHSLLNITPNGSPQEEVTWRGCEHGEKLNDLTEV